jgi:hypothetical protein
MGRATRRNRAGKRKGGVRDALKRKKGQKEFFTRSEGLHRFDVVEGRRSLQITVRARDDIRRGNPLDLTKQKERKKGNETD